MVVVVVDDVFLTSICFVVVIWGATFILGVTFTFLALTSVLAVTVVVWLCEVRTDAVGTLDLFFFLVAVS